MTISSTTVRNSYSGDNSTTTFSYTFKIFQDSDIQVIIRSTDGTETIKTITTHYTVTGAGASGGGSVIFTSGNIPTSTQTVVLRRNIPQTQAIDYIANDPFPAESHEEGLDRATMAIQQLQEEVTRSIKLSRTNTMTSTEFTVGATARANKILAFDASGEISVTQELGTYRGTDATITTSDYVQRDIVKSTTAGELNNVYICIADSVVGDLLTDTNHFDLLIDAVSAAASATAAAASASAASTSATNAASSASAASSSASAASSSASSAAADAASTSALATAVAGNSANINIVAGISSNVTTVATNNTNVTLVGANITNVNSVAGGVIPTRVSVIADGTSISINADTADFFTQANTQAVGTLTVNAPTGTLVNAQRLILRIRSTNIQTFSWNAIFEDSDELFLPTATSGSTKYDYFGFFYNSAANKWQLVSKLLGF
jgi:hypothetical protein